MIIYANKLVNGEYCNCSMPLFMIVMDIKLKSNSMSSKTVQKYPRAINLKIVQAKNRALEA